MPRVDDTVDEKFYEDNFGHGKRVDNVGSRTWYYLSNVFDGPVTWARKNFVLKFRGPEYPYYHQRFRRVPTIDKCYTDDHACVWEANVQYQRDKQVDQNILAILRNRIAQCVTYNREINEFHNFDFLCPKEKKDFKDAELAYFIKYGDLGYFGNVIDAFMKQKHRLIIERRRALKEKKQEECDE